MKIRRHYALSDSFTGETPREYTHGFANTKEVICFKTSRERANWLSSTRLLTARPLTRSQALKWANSGGDGTGRYGKVVKIAGKQEYDIIRESRRFQ